MEFWIGLCLILGALILTLLTISGKNKGIINDDVIDVTEKIEVLLPIIAAMVEKLTDIPDEKIEIIEDIVQKVIEYVQAVYSLPDGNFPDREELLGFSLDLLEINELELSKEDSKLLTSIVSMIYITLIG